MAKLNILRGQHDDALNMAQRLVELIDGYEAGAPAHQILMQLNRLYGVLRVHLAHEDVELYPFLLKSADPKVARIARLYVEEMGNVALDLECFAQHWSCSASIATNFQEFREAAHDLLIALVVRIERENQYLYPLAEADAAGTQKAA
ncbi:MAG TPA: hemerythrin domain-containing protein [Sphingomicrobium sp.]|nr:hemerythrin domain-containing protein [Sphingomicrobium sp.]